MTEYFSPFINRTKIKDNVYFTSLDNFKKKFKITSDVLSPMKIFWEKYPNAILAGGKLIDFVLNKSIGESTNDYDVYGIGYLDERYFDRSLLKNIKTFIHLTEFELHDFKFQFINSREDSTEPEDIICNFDFRCCAICTNGRYIWWVKDSLQDIRDKKLTTLSPKLSVGTHIRLSKYITKGYTIDYPSYLNLCITSLEAAVRSKKANKLNLMLNRSYKYNREDMEYEVVDDVTSFALDEVFPAGEAAQEIIL